MTKMVAAVTQYRLTHRVSRERIEQWAAGAGKQFVYAVRSPWWSLFDDAWMPYRLPGSIVPCDPRGFVLMQVDASVFWKCALENEDHHGRHGIDALVAAFHLNVEVYVIGKGWQPTSLPSWEEYNELLDKE